MYSYFPEKIQSIIKKPFAFVSYCHGNDIVYNQVQLLVSYLRDKGIPVVYDEGGLDPGTELTQFENLILENNCVYVLVVCDKCYLKKVEDNEGGAWREYFNISNDYPKHKRVYIPLVFDALLPIFSAKVYIDFSDTSKQTLNKIENSLELLQKKKKDSKIRAEILANDASKLCDRKSYKAAYKKVGDAITIYTQQKKPTRVFLAYLYNLKLYICIKLKKVNAAISTAKDLDSVITNRLDHVKKAMYYGNCALAYRMRDSGSNEYEEYAKKAYLSAKKGDDDEFYYYACMYATALYETEQYLDGYRVAKEALESFQNKHKDREKYKKEDYVMFAMIKGNLSEIAVACGEDIPENRQQKSEFLLEAKDNIMDILSISEIVDDNICREMYSIAVLVFEALKKYYSI